MEVQEPHSRGIETKLKNRPRWDVPLYKPAGKLKGKKALVTGGDSGIGRAVAILYAREGADVAITFLPEEYEDALDVQAQIKKYGRECLLIEGDLIDASFCEKCVDTVVEELGGLDILVSNGAHQITKDSLEEITSEEWDRTFKVDVYAYFHLAKAAVRHMKSGSAIIATSSETAFFDPEGLPECSPSKGAIDTFTKCLAKMLIEKGIRVNAVAPGPVWTPLNPAEAVASSQPIARTAQPEEMAPAYVFLASSADSSYITGAILPETGGLNIN